MAQTSEPETSTTNADVLVRLDSVRSNRPPLGAALFNNVSRRYRNPAQRSGLLNFDQDGFYVGVPAVR